MKKINDHLEEKIFRDAMEAFRKNIPMQIETLAQEPVYKNEFRPDRRIKMTIQGRVLDYFAEIKTAVTKATILPLMMKREKLNHPLLLIAKYVNAPMAERLRQDSLEFIDTGGNAFIHKPPLYIFVKGNRRPDFFEQAPLQRRFKPVGQRMIFAFLCNPGLVNKTYREIAAATEVALGTVGWIMKELTDLGFLFRRGKRGLKLVQREKLLLQWVNAYPEQLRPKQILGRYRGENGWWQQKKLEPLIAQWGGEVAAARLTQYLKPELITVYTTMPELDQFLLKNRLKRDIAGDVEILARFWTPVERREDDDLVHPILIYADLLATGNQRNRETAKMIYEQHVIRFIRED